MYATFARKILPRSLSGTVNNKVHIIIKTPNRCLVSRKICEKEPIYAIK